MPLGSFFIFMVLFFAAYEIIFNPAAATCVVYVMVNVQHIGDLSGGRRSMDRMPNRERLGGAIKAQGVVSIISSFFGGLPTSAFWENVGIIVSKPRHQSLGFGGAAFVFLCGGSCPKLGNALMIPQPVIGGATISVWNNTLNESESLSKMD